MSKKIISSKFSVYFEDFSKWLQLIVVIRNISAHHSRLWNKEYIIKLSKTDKIFGDFFSIKNTNGKIEVLPNYYNTVLIINYLLEHINKNFHWLNDLENLFNNFSHIPKEKMGFNKNFKKDFMLIKSISNNIITPRIKLINILISIFKK